MVRPLPTGRPGASLLEDWEDVVAPIVAASFNCRLRIGPSGIERSFDRTLGRTVSTPLPPIYDGPAGIGPASTTGGARVVETAEQLVAERVYEIELPRDADEYARIKTDHLVAVTRASDPRLDGARLRVVGFENADRAWSRILFAALVDQPA